MVEMETLSCLVQDNGMMIRWSKEENKMFERAIAMFDEEIPDRWQRIAAMIPGKSVSDVMKQYSELEADVSDIEAGLVPIPGYSSSSFTVEMMANCRVFGALRSTKRPFIDRFSSSSDHERKKGIPWTEEEHRRFLMGLEKHGKGDWRNISRNFVISKTPTQVASHAQKYFIRQNSIGCSSGSVNTSTGGGKDKRRPSIHDITTFHITSSNSTVMSKRNGNKSSSSSSSNDLSSTLMQTILSPNAFLNWTRARGDSFGQYPPYGFASNVA